MNVEVFIHGCLNGHDFWGNEEDRSYFDIFDNKSTDEVKFFIQVRSLNGHPNCYYNYLVYKSVGANKPIFQDNNGRAGAYFGITLRLERYCKDFMNIYRILDTVYNVHILGKYVIEEKGILKYTIANLKDASNAFKAIADETIKLVSSAFTANDFVSLAGFATGGDQCSKCNFYEYSPESVMATVKQRGCIAVSPYYSTKKEKEIQQTCERQIKEKADAFAKEKATLNSNISSANAKNAKLTRKLEEKEQNIDELENEIQKLQQELKEIEQTEKIVKNLDELKQPIFNLAAMLEQTKEQSHKKISLSKLAKPLLLFINVVVLLYVAVYLHKLPTTETNDNTEQVPIYEEQDITVTQDSAQTTSSFNIDDVKIDLPAYDGTGYLVLNNTYDVIAHNGSKDCRWEGEGCEITETDNPLQVQVKPTANSVKITYVVGTQRKDRDLTAK